MSLNTFDESRSFGFACENYACWWSDEVRKLVLDLETRPAGGDWPAFFLQVDRYVKQYGVAYLWRWTGMNRTTPKDVLFLPPPQDVCTYVTSLGVGYYEINDGGRLRVVDHSLVTVVRRRETKEAGVGEDGLIQGVVQLRDKYGKDGLLRAVGFVLGKEGFSVQLLLPPISCLSSGANLPAEPDPKPESKPKPKLKETILFDGVEWERVCQCDRYRPGWSFDVTVDCLACFYFHNHRDDPGKRLLWGRQVRGVTAEVKFASPDGQPQTINVQQGRFVMPGAGEAKGDGITDDTAALIAGAPIREGENKYWGPSEVTRSCCQEPGKQETWRDRPPLL